MKPREKFFPNIVTGTLDILNFLKKCTISYRQLKPVTVVDSMVKFTKPYNKESIFITGGNIETSVQNMLSRSRHPATMVYGFSHRLKIRPVYL